MNAMLILAPSDDMCFAERLAVVGTGTLMNETAKEYAEHHDIPGTLRIASRDQLRMAAANATMLIMLSAPMISAAKFGKMRPKMEPALVMAWR
jgi:hypothetical protein